MAESEDLHNEERLQEPVGELQEIAKIPPEDHDSYLSSSYTEGEAVPNEESSNDSEDVIKLSKKKTTTQSFKQEKQGKRRNRVQTFLSSDSDYSLGESSCDESRKKDHIQIPKKSRKNRSPPRRNVESEFIEEDAHNDPDYAKVLQDVEELKCCSNSCLKSLDLKAVYLNRLKLRKMDKKYRQAFMHGQMFNMSQTLPCGGWGGKTGSRITKYYFNGEPVCLETWLYTNYMHDKTYARIMPLLKKNGPAQIRHGNTGRGRHLPTDAVTKVEEFLKSKSALGVEVPVRNRNKCAPLPMMNKEGNLKKSRKSRAKSNVPTIWLPHTFSKKSLFEEYKQSLEKDSAPVSWGSFHMIWEKSFSNLKIKKPPVTQTPPRSGSRAVTSRSFESPKINSFQSYQRLPPPQQIGHQPLDQSSNEIQHKFAAEDQPRVSSSPSQPATSAQLQSVQYIQAASITQQTPRLVSPPDQHLLTAALLVQPPTLLRPPAQQLPQQQQASSQADAHFTNYYY